MLHNIINKHSNQKKVTSLCIGILAIILLFIFVPSFLLNNNQNANKTKKIRISASKVVSSKNTSSLKNTALMNNSSSSPSNANDACQVSTDITNQLIPSYGVKVEDALKEDGKKTAYLTFDDGNSIGNHTYSHNLRLLYPGNVLNINQFMSEVDKTSNILNQRNMVSVDWNAYDFDAEGAKKNSYQLLNNVKNSVGNQKKVIILMHDTYGKEETAKALPSIIEFLKSNGYEFKTLY